MGSFWLRIGSVKQHLAARDVQILFFHGSRYMDDVPVACGALLPLDEPFLKTGLVENVLTQGDLQ